MGRKATFYLISTLLAIFTLILAILSAIGRFSGHIHPCSDGGIVALIGLALPLLLLIDLALLVFWLFKRSWWAVVPVAALLLNWGFLSAYFQFSVSSDSQDGNSPDRIKIATYNIHGFRNGDFKSSVGEIAAALQYENVDIVCLQEFMVSKKYGLDSIRKAFSFLPYCYTPVEKTVLGGVALLSRYPIAATGHLTFPGTDNSAIWADIVINKQKIRVFDVHLQTTAISSSRAEMAMLRRFDPLGEGGQTERAAQTIVSRLKNNFCKRAIQADAIRSVIDTTSYPVIVCGDFNDTPASYAYHHIGQGLEDGFKTCGNGYGYTYKGFWDLLRIDFILHSPAIKGVKYYSTSLPWSDHNPVFFEFLPDTGGPSNALPEGSKN